MKLLNQVKISFYSRSVNEGFARAALAAFLVQADPTVPQLADVKTAVSEAVHQLHRSRIPRRHRADHHAGGPVRGL